MKATLNAQELRNAVRWVSKVAKSSTLPILEGVMLRAEENDRITVQATNLTTTLTRYVDAEVTDRSGGVCVGAKLLKKYLAKVGKKKDAILEIEGNSFITELGKVTLKSVTANPVDDWPFQDREQDYDVALHINLDNLPLKKLAPFMSTGDNRPVLSSMLVEQREDDKLAFIAADGFRLVSYGFTEGADLASWLIPANAIHRMAELKGDAILGFNASRVCLQAENSFVDAVLTDGRFPDYKAIIKPDNAGTWATFDTEEFANALEILKTVTDEVGYLTILELHPDEDAILRDGARDCEAVVSTDWEEEPFSIGFSSQLMLDSLALCGEEARIMFQRPSETTNYSMAIQIVADNVTMVVMPMHIKR